MSRNKNEEQLNMLNSDYDFNPADDPDNYDEYGEVNDPDSPIWDGSDVQNDYWGDDPTGYDPNEITQD